MEYISFIRAEDLQKDIKEAAQSGRKVSTSDGLIGIMEQSCSSTGFMLYTPKKVFTFFAESMHARDEIVRKCSETLSSIFGKDIWSRKTKASFELDPLLREQFLIDVEKQQSMLRMLEEIGFGPGSRILGSTSKDKNGVLQMFQHSDLLDLEEDKEVEAESVGKWREYYFVLKSDTLYYFEHSKDLSPSGFVCLKFASIEIDQSCLFRNDYVFYISTPLRTLVLKAKHEVALSTWISALEKAMSEAGKEKGELEMARGVMHRRTSNELLQEVRRLQSPVGTFSGLLKHPQGFKMFQEYLKRKSCQQELECLTDLKSFAVKVTGPRDVACSFAAEIQKKYFSAGEPSEIAEVPSTILDCLAEADVSSVTLDMFKEAWKFVNERLKSRFDDFKLSRECEELMKSYWAEQGSSSKKSDSHLSFENNVLGFEISVKGSKPKKVRLDSSKGFVTIGRDVSNDIVLDDDRVSRSHGKFEFTHDGGTDFTILVLIRIELRFLDLGSSHGSRLNDVKIIETVVEVGDVLKLGHTDLKLVLEHKSYFQKGIADYFRRALSFDKAE